MSPTWRTFFLSWKFLFGSPGNNRSYLVVWRYVGLNGFSLVKGVDGQFQAG